MDNKEFEKIDLDELDRAAGGADTPEQLAFWDYRDAMVEKYGSVDKIPQGEELNKFYYLKGKAAQAYQWLKGFNIAAERGEFND